ncbi:MAG: hypothetical protein E6R13_05645 [Spirochaetes bacterium]|nr:MAG: hypothetical protein E6R13_05645 [Spirochaetota bacterium]
MKNDILRVIEESIDENFRIEKRIGYSENEILPDPLSIALIKRTDNQISPEYSTVIFDDVSLNSIKNFVENFVDNNGMIANTNSRIETVLSYPMAHISYEIGKILSALRENDLENIINSVPENLIN